MGKPSKDSLFLGRKDGAEMLAKQALAALPYAQEQRILDLGCGVGDLAAALKRERHDASVVGLDFSAANILAARSQTDAVTFHLGDYLSWQSDPFDMIVADSVLHLMDAPTDKLAAKLAADLKPGGALLATIPADTAWNRVLLVLRLIYRRAPLALDGALLWLGALVYPNVPKEVLKGRIPYMRFVPPLFTQERLAAFERAGLRVDRSMPLPSPSTAKLKHYLMVWRK